MKTINIKITGNGTLEAMCGCLYLFTFEYRDWYDKKWYFWPNSDFNPTILDGPEFPVEYFNNLCKAKYFCLTGTDVWPEEVKIIAGKKLLKAAPATK